MIDQPAMLMIVSLFHDKSTSNVIGRVTIHDTSKSNVNDRVTIP